MYGVIIDRHTTYINMLLLSLILAHRVSNCSHGPKSVLGVGCLDASMLRLIADNWNLLFNGVV